jgi:hypothetical protein
MRDPRRDPQMGDKLEHAFGGERRSVLARDGNGIRFFSERDGTIAVCAPEAWYAWAKDTSIVDLGG